MSANTTSAPTQLRQRLHGLVGNTFACCHDPDHDQVLPLAGAGAFANMRVGSGMSVDQAAAAPGEEQHQRQGHARTLSVDSSMDAAKVAPSSSVSRPRLSWAPYWSASRNESGRPDSSPALAAALQTLSRQIGDQLPPWFHAPAAHTARSRAAQEVSAFERVLHEATAGLRTAASLAPARCATEDDDAVLRAHHGVYFSSRMLDALGAVMRPEMRDRHAETCCPHHSHCSGNRPRSHRRSEANR